MKLENMKALVLGIASVAAAAAWAKPVLMGDTSKPTNSVFHPQDKVELTFRIGGLEPKKEGPNLQVKIVDEYERVLATFDEKLLADWNGNEEVVLKKVPCGKLGFYRVYAQLADGTKLTTPWATRRDGEMTYAVVRDPKTREIADYDILQFYNQDDPNLVGLRPEFHGHDGMPPMFPLQGVWGTVEREGPGSYVNNPDRDKIRLGSHIMLLSAAPRWKKEDMERCFRMKNHVDNGRPPALTEEGEKAFEAFLRAYVPNYRKQYADVKPRLYEVSSEWYAAENGSRTLKDIVRCYEIAYKVVHELDPEGIVCGTGYGYGDHTRAFLKAGIGKYLDALTLHPYFNPDPVEPNGWVNFLRKGVRETRELAGKDLLVYNTEFGFATYDLAEQEPVQMKHIVRGQTIAVGEGWKSVSLFIRMDFRMQPGFGYIYNLSLGRSHTSHMGDFTAPKTSPKPVYPAASAMCWFLANQKACGDIPFLGDTVVGYVFKHQKNGKVNIAVWDWGKTPDNPNRLNLKVGRKSVEVADHMGNVRKVACNEKGELVLDLFDMPTYIFDVDPDIWEKADGERVQLAAEFKARQEAARRAKGIEIGAVRPCLTADGAIGAEVSLTDVSGKPNAGTLALKVVRTGETRSVPYSVAADKTGTFTVPLGGLDVQPFDFEKVEVTAKLADGRVVTSGAEANFFVVPRADGIEIDGDFAKWAKVPNYELDPKTHVLNCPKNYKPGDQFVKCAFAYDAKGLLFYFDVDDDAWVGSKRSDKSCWSADAVQIALAKEFLYEETGNTLLDQMTEARSLYTFARAPQDAPQDCAYRHVSYDRETPEPKHKAGPVAVNDGKSGYEMKSKVEKLANGRVRHQWEIRMPWHAVNMGEGKPGDRLGFGFCVNDFDGDVAGWEGGAYTCMGAFHLHEPLHFGAMILGK